MRIQVNLLPHLLGTLWLLLAAPQGRQLHAALLFLVGNICCFMLSTATHWHTTTHHAVSRPLLRSDY